MVKAGLTKVTNLHPLEVGGARGMERELLGKEGLMLITVPEVRRLLYRLMGMTNNLPAAVDMFSRRRQQYLNQCQGGMFIFSVSGIMLGISREPFGL